MGDLHTKDIEKRLVLVLAKNKRRTRSKFPLLKAEVKMIIVQGTRVAKVPYSLGSWRDSGREFLVLLQGNWEGFQNFVF